MPSEAPISAAMRAALADSAVCIPFLAVAVESSGLPQVAGASTAIAPNLIAQRAGAISELVVRQNLADDPELLAKVATRNGMTPARLMGLTSGQIMQMVREYIAERELLAKYKKVAPIAIDEGSRAPGQ